MSLHPDHALFVMYQQHPRDLLAPDQQQLAKLAGDRATYRHPHDSLAPAFQALLHRLTAFAMLTLRERSAPATEQGELSAPPRTNGGASSPPLNAR